MFVFRKKQIEILERVPQRNFEDESIGHLAAFAPELSQILKEEGVRRVVQFGIERAGRYGLTDRAPLRFYFELMFTLGSFFDTDMQLPWAGQVLSDSTISNQYRRVDRLYAAMADYLDRVAGAHNEYAVAALTRFNSANFETGAELGGDPSDRILSQLSAIYPEKHEFVGDSALRAMISRAAEAAAHYGAPTARGATIFSALMYGFGAGIAKDPIYPWVSATLENMRGADPKDRLERVASKARVYAERVIKNLGHR